MSKRLRPRALSAIVLAGMWLVLSHDAPIRAQVVPRPAPTAGCDVNALTAAKGTFLSLSKEQSATQRAGVTEELRTASAAYVAMAEACYQELYAGATDQLIDEGIMWYSPDGSQPFLTWGTKWGAGSPFAGGSHLAGPRIAGGVVTYSFVANGISTDGDAAVALTSLPTYSACFLTEISNAFAAWARVANVHFVEVSDNGAAFNASGATGDIRIAAHTFDGPSNVLAHAYGPPPNGTSASGDVHFDRAENWGCTAGSGKIDIGIVATHEIGHSIGLGHEPTNTAVMNPIYNVSVTGPLADDITGASSIYGTASRPAGDVDGDGASDVTVYRPSTGGWWTLGSSSKFATSSVATWGLLNDVPVPGDYDNDGKLDLAVFRPTTREWWIAWSRANFATYSVYTWGLSGDTPVPADYDGDGKTDIAVYRPSTGGWWILKSSTGFTAYSTYGWGLTGDVPLPGDFDGDGKADLVIYRPANGAWWILKSSSSFATYSSYAWGLGGDVPAPADYDGDGRTDIAVYRPTTGGWWILKSSGNFTAYNVYGWGLGGDVPAPADFDGDGKSDIAVYRPSSGAWWILKFSTAFGTYNTYTWGLSGDVPLFKRP